MTDGLIGNAHITVPDLMERVIAFRTLNYNAPHEFKEPNEFKVDIATGTIVKNDELIAEKRMTHDGYGRLVSPQYSSHTEPWKKEMIATCGAGGNHKAPDQTCKCGLYCYYTLKEISYNYSYTGREVYACVSVEGTLEAHTLGMRVEKMIVEAIYSLSFPGLGNLCEELDIMFFPVESYNREQFLMACKEYGDELPVNMRAGNQSDKELPF